MRPGLLVLKAGEGTIMAAPEAKQIEEAELQARLDPARRPRHVAIIMDGNGRWAEERGLPRWAGHRAGSESVRAVVEASPDLGISILTLYTFSAENWRRPREEVELLLGLIEENLLRELEELKAKGVRVQVLGRVDELPASLQQAFGRVVSETRHNHILTLNLAVNYGGRREILDAALRLARRVQQGELELPAISEEVFAQHLYLPDLPDPDLLLRTGGEVRVSNYLLWQIAYAEIWVTPVLWPDFRRVHLLQALLAYQQRQRRFGGLNHGS